MNLVFSLSSFNAAVTREVKNGVVGILGEKFLTCCSEPCLSLFLPASLCYTNPASLLSLLTLPPSPCFTSLSSQFSSLICLVSSLPHSATFTLLCFPSCLTATPLPCLASPLPRCYTLILPCFLLFSFCYTLTLPLFPPASLLHPRPAFLSSYLLATPPPCLTYPMRHCYTLPTLFPPCVTATFSP